MRSVFILSIWIWAAVAWASPVIHDRHDDPYREHRPMYSRVPEKTAADPSEQIFEVLIGQGIAGVGLIFLSWFIWKTNGQARTDRRELEGRLIALIEKTNTTLVEQKAQLENIGRELERIR